MRTFIRQSLLLASKDTKIFFRDRFAVVFAFAFPLLFTLGFTLALGGILSDDETSAGDAGDTRGRGRIA